MTLAENRSATAAAQRSREAPDLVRWVCTKNPFYVVSALLVFLGLWVSFGSQVSASQSWALLFGMAGYTLLLAVAACLLVRALGVWDDVRTVLLLVVLMFLATSVTFDEVLARTPSRGVACYLFGLLFAVVVSEGILRGIGLRLPALFRVPYYLILALFFLYPVALTPLLDQPKSEALAWALFGFSLAAGLLSLTLLPAIRRGRADIRENGSPWRWAWYPWTLFGVLGFGVLARSALLAWSMHHIERAETEPYLFGLYFLIPFLLAVGVLLLEIGLIERHRGVLRTALVLPAGLLVLAMAGHRPEAIYQGFLSRVITRFGGTPLYLTLLASAGFYAYAILRRVRSATELLAAALVALAFVTPATMDLRELAAPRPLPILAAAVLQLGLGLRRRESWRCLIGSIGLVAAVMIALPGTGSAGLRSPVAYHLVLIAVLIVGVAFEDILGRLLRGVGAVMAMLGCLAVMSGRFGHGETIPAWATDLYPPAMSLVIAGYGLLLGHRVSLQVAAVALACWAASFGWRGYCALRMLATGLDYIALGLAFFALAMLVSVAKSGKYGDKAFLEPSEEFESP